MNNEIKEILKLKNLVENPTYLEEINEYGYIYDEEIDNCYVIYPDEAKILLDYITNLQQRCEYLERSNNRREDTILGLRQELYEQEDYKSRCEKASNKIKKIRENAIKYGADHDAVICNDLLNILQNEGDSQ